MQQNLQSHPTTYPQKSTLGPQAPKSMIRRMQQRSDVPKPWSIDPSVRHREAVKVGMFNPTGYDIFTGSKVPSLTLIDWSGGGPTPKYWCHTQSLFRVGLPHQYNGS